MVYVVERYLPGLSRSHLLRSLSELERVTDELGAEGAAVRYLGSTIVLGDEACFCQFEGPSETAVAEANRKAGLSFDRIVPAVTVTRTKGAGQMAVSTPVPTTLQIRRSRLFGLMAAVAVLAAGITWAVSTYAVSSGTAETALPSEQAAFQQFATGISRIGQAQQQSAARQSLAFRQLATGISSIASAQQEAATLHALGLTPKEETYVQAMSSLTPVELAAAFGGPGAVLDALGLTPKEAKYVQAITALTPVEQAAAYGGRSGERNARQREASFKQLAKGISAMASAQQTAAVLDALGLDKQERQYVQGITALTKTQQAAAFGR